MFAACNGDDDRPTTYGRAVVWAGGGDMGMRDLEPGTQASDLRLPILADPLLLGSDSAADIRGIGVRADGTIAFEFGGGLYLIDTEGKIELINTSSPQLMDAGFDNEGDVIGAPWFPGGEALARFRNGEWEQIGADETEPQPGEGRLAVAPDGTAVRTVSGRGLLRVAPDGSVSGEQVDIGGECGTTRGLGVAAGDDGEVFVGLMFCGGIARVVPDQPAEVVVADRPGRDHCQPRVPSRDPQGIEAVIAYALALDGAGRLWVADPYCGTLEYVEDGELVGVSHEIADVEVPVDLGFDGDGNLYVMDAGPRAILKIAAADLPEA